MRTVGLRIDVDTLRGTRIGVPCLIELLGKYGIRASVFFSVGPDNMGRHLRRLLRPAFFLKMLRTRATQLYGWDILLRGTLWSGPVIGERCTTIIRKTGASGHEIGLHAWDHHLWQMKLDTMSRQAVSTEVGKAYRFLESILGESPACFAAPGWRVTPEALDGLEEFPFRYRSDCRGYSFFRPIVGDRIYGCVQVPTTLPTYDEAVGRDCTSETYNDFLLNRMSSDGLQVLTIHAEVEGIACRDMFEAFLEKAKRIGFCFLPLGELLDRTHDEVPIGGIEQRTLPGREGWISFQTASRPT